MANKHYNRSLAYWWLAGYNGIPYTYIYIYVYIYMGIIFPNSLRSTIKLGLSAFLDADDLTDLSWLFSVLSQRPDFRDEFAGC